MLSTIVDQLTTLTSRQVVIAAFVPVLVFAFLNGFILYLEFESFRGWVDPQVWGVWRVFDAAALAIALAVIAFVLSSLSGFLKQTLEGQHAREGSRFAKFLRRQENQRLDGIRQAYSRARDSAGKMRDNKDAWKQQLDDRIELGLAAIDGAGNPKNSYDGKSGPAAAAMEILRKARSAAEELSTDDIEKAVEELGKVLSTNSIRQHPPGRTDKPLARDHDELLRLFDYAEDDWFAREVALADRLQARFGSGKAAAPTAFGNVAEAMQDYGLTRYGPSLATFWSRLQPILQKDTNLQTSLQEAKAQLDFLVNSFWLSLITTVVWLIALPILGDSLAVFLLVAVLGPSVIWMCYVAAVENYVAFGEVVRSAIDLHRFELLDQLSIARPEGLRDEKALWAAMRRITSYGHEGIDLNYHHSKPDA